MTVTLALDLEGTLISNAVSCFPRPGLRDFLIGVECQFDRLVVYTTVAPMHVRRLAKDLANEGLVPHWLADVEIVIWQGGIKDLRFIPGADIERTLLVDDIEAYIHPEQRSQWIKIEPFEPPYPSTDRELARVAAVLDARRQLLLNRQ